MYQIKLDFNLNKNKFSGVDEKNSFMFETYKQLAGKYRLFGENLDIAGGVLTFYVTRQTARKIKKCLKDGTIKLS